MWLVENLERDCLYGSNRTLIPLRRAILYKSFYRPPNKHIYMFKERERSKTGMRVKHTFLQIHDEMLKNTYLMKISTSVILFQANIQLMI